MSQALCPFCEPPRERVILESEKTLTFFDAYPVTEGHALVIPKRHVKSIFDLTPEDLAVLWLQVEAVRKLLSERFTCDAFNIGVNDGEAAGQTVSHGHIHVIPRRTGDVVDARGGVRWVIADKAKYW